MVNMKYINENYQCQNAKVVVITKQIVGLLGSTIFDWIRELGWEIRISQTYAKIHPYYSAIIKINEHRLTLYLDLEI